MTTYYPISGGNQTIEEICEILDRERLSPNQIGLLSADILVGDITTDYYARIRALALSHQRFSRVADNALLVLNLTKTIECQ